MDVKAEVRKDGAAHLPGTMSYDFSITLVQTPLRVFQLLRPFTLHTSTSLSVHLSGCKHVHLKEIREKKNEGAKDIPCLLSPKLHALVLIPLKFAYWEKLEQHLIFLPT